MAPDRLPSMVYPPAGAAGACCAHGAQSAIPDTAWNISVTMRTGRFALRKSVADGVPPYA